MAVRKVNFHEEYAKTEIQPVLDSLYRDLVGLAPVKERVRQLSALLLVQSIRKNLGVASENSSVGLHMSFTGNPGTGKTEVAGRMADVLFRLGYVSKGHLVAVTRADLVGQYVGHTAPKTKEVLKKAMGGVLFVDEAYCLYRPNNEKDYGSEAIEILLQVMENRREDLVVILAGYKDKMDSFYRSNPGLSSRVTHHIDFPDYTSHELTEMACRMFEEDQYRLGRAGCQGAEMDPGELKELVRRWLRFRKFMRPLFANARTVRHFVDSVERYHSSAVFKVARVSEGGGFRSSSDHAHQIKKRIFASDLIYITAYDVLGGVKPFYPVGKTRWSSELSLVERCCSIFGHLGGTTDVESALPLGDKIKTLCNSLRDFQINSWSQ
jgi:probable Rubsico expression protein CbbX